MERNYPINGTGKTTGDDAEDELMEKLQAAVEKEDFVEYENLVNQNVGVLNGIERDFWQETFSGESHGEILFWINCPKRQLSIHDLNLIPLEYEDLFQLGLKREDLDLDGAEDVIEMMEENMEGEVLESLHTRDDELMRGFSESQRQMIEDLREKYHEEEHTRILSKEEREILQNRINSIRKLMEK